MNWLRNAGADQLRLVPGSGAVASLVHHGREFLFPSETLFTLTFRSGRIVTGNDFALCSDNGEILTFRECRTLADLQVSIRLYSQEHSFRVSPHEIQIPPGEMLVSCDLAPLCVPQDYTILDPVHGGTLVPPDKRFDSTRPYDVDEHWGRYPGICQVPFLAAFDHIGGIRFFARDRQCRPKRIMHWGTERYGLHIETYDAAEGIYHGNYELEFSAFEGDWMTAAEAYRQWLLSSHLLEKARKHPDFVQQSPLFVTYVVSGEGTLSAVPNEFVPYENALPGLLAIAEETESKVLALPMRWEHRGPWTPIQQWPPVGGGDSFCRLVEKLHQHGHYAGIYGSGTSWTTYVYSAETEYPSPPDHFPVRDSDGKIHQSDFKPFRRSVPLCLMQKEVRKRIVGEAVKVAASGVDFYQLFDQDLGGEVPHCYASDHGHLSAPGAHETEAGLMLHQELRDAFRKAGCPAVLGTEDAAAEPYIIDFPVNDLRTNAVHFIPFYSFLTHEFTANFSGNQCEYARFDVEKSPENLLYRTALGFANGAMLTVPMRKNGELDWGAGAPWTLPAPPRKEFMTLAGRLNALRRKYPEYLLDGRMMPVPELHVAKHRLFLKNGDKITVPAVLCSCWQSPAGEKKLFAANFLPKDRKITVSGKQYRVPALDGAVIPV